MKKHIKGIGLVTAIIISLTLTGCGNKSLSGESENWIGRYTGTEEDNERVRSFELIPKDKDEISVPITYSIIAEKDDVNLEGTMKMDTDHLPVKTTCSDCRVALKSEEVVIKLKWDGEEETLVLKK
ncbi:hypothetical protein [Virgibacillus sp. DJP39]|uniref:hypothetical protein n=1 Tax=Virgibacillus sp. DJP39 TaxID=3409790 RepID=UPI003BB73B4F